MKKKLSHETKNDLTTDCHVLDWTGDNHCDRIVWRYLTMDELARIMRGFGWLLLIIIVVLAYARFLIWGQTQWEHAIWFGLALPFLVGLSWLLGGKE